MDEDKIKVFEDYLRAIGPISTAKYDLGDDVWTAIIGYLFSDGFIKEIDWSSNSGQVFYQVLSEHLGGSNGE